jgi:hypothetical protein
MMFMCTSRFELEGKQLEFIEEYLSCQENKATQEAKDDKKDEDFLQPISDNEDDLTSTQVQASSEHASRKRGRSNADAEPVAEENQQPLIELDEDGEPPLPDNSMILQKESDTQRRSSGRAPKRSKRDDSQFVSY